ncbi:hypothetical protein M378DRAFT_156487, partial [Amanita muscaria Koide BX008]
MGRILDHDYIVPLLWMRDKGFFPVFVCGNVNETNETLSEWRKSTKPSAGRRIQVMLKIAKAIQYLHSMGVIFQYIIGDIFLDSDFRAKLHFRGTTLRYIRETPSSHHMLGSDDKILYSNQTNIFIFGYLFYEMYFDRDMNLRDRLEFKRDIIAEKPSEPEISEDAWQLIQRCCAEDPRSRPSINEIVQEMESWKI